MTASGTVVSIRAFNNYPKAGDRVRVTVGYELGSIGTIEFDVPFEEAQQWHVGDKAEISVTPSSRP